MATANNDKNKFMYEDVKIGHVVLCSYLDFEGTLRDGMFVIVGIDKHNNYATYEAIKLSTTEASYQVLIRARDLTCLSYDSYLNCTDLQKIASDQCKTILGRLSSKCMSIVKTQIKNAWRHFYDQMDEYIEENNLYNQTYSENPNRNIEVKLGDSNNLVIDGKSVSLEAILKAIQDGR